MPYGDEEVIANRLSAVEQKELSIYNNIVIQGNPVSFARRNLSVGISMILPDSFGIMQPKYAKKKFPYEDRPQLIMSSEDTTVCFAFDMGKNRGKDLGERLPEYMYVVKKLHPSNVFLSNDYIKTNSQLTIAYYSFRSQALDGDLFNMNYFADIPAGELFGWFTCPYGLFETWEPLCRQMVETIEYDI